MVSNVDVYRNVILNDLSILPLTTNVRCHFTTDHQCKGALYRCPLIKASPLALSTKVTEDLSIDHQYNRIHFLLTANVRGHANPNDQCRGPKMEGVPYHLSRM